MPNFANKSRLPPMDGAMITELVRASVTATSSTTASQTPKSTLARSAARQYSFSPGGSIVAGGRLLSQTVRGGDQTVSRSSFEVAWALIDSIGAVWAANADLSRMRSVGVRVPHQIGMGSETQRFQWTGTGWIVTTNLGRDVFHVSSDLTTWTFLPTLSSVSAAATKVVFTSNPSIMYFISNGAGLHKSTDGGQTWTLRATDAPILGANHIDLISTSGRLVLSSSSSTTLPRIHTSDDDGTTWTLRETSWAGVSTFLDSSKIGSRLYVGARNGTMYTSTDNGTTWSELSPPLRPNDDVYVTQMKQHGSTYIAVVTGGSGGGPAWTPDPLTTPLTLGTTTDGSVLRGWDYYSLQLRYNGTRFSFTNISTERLYTSTDGKLWSPVPHPTSGLQFVVGAPKVTDPTKNLM